MSVRASVELHIVSDSTGETAAKLVLALGELRLALRVPVWIGDARRTGDELVSTDPGRPERVVEADVQVVLVIGVGEVRGIVDRPRRAG